MKITQTSKEIIFTFPRFKKRWNPYGTNKQNDSDFFGTYPTFTGLIIRHNKNSNHWDEMGFALTIDMAYKDKPDQIGSIVIAWFESEKEFVEECKELKINIHEIEI